MTTYRIHEIDWDTDGELVEDLPTSLTLTSDEVLEEDDIAEWLTDEYGWLVQAFDYYIIEK